MVWRLSPHQLLLCTRRLRLRSIPPGWFWTERTLSRTLGAGSHFSASGSAGRQG